MKNKEIKDEYCKEFGYGSFNKYNENDYSKWLEQQLLIQRVSQQRELFFSLMDFMKSQSRVSMMSHGMHEELWNEFKEKHSG